MFTTRPELRGTFGMVASTHWIASAVGMSVLERGGNAFDAAVAGGLALQVVEPHLNGPGGEAPILTYEARSKEVRVICGQGPAPGAASIEAYRELGYELIPATGMLAACVPGAFDAWMRLLRDYGTMPLDQVFGYAIGLATHGYPLTPRIATVIEDVRGLFEEHWSGSAELYLKAGSPPLPGRLFTNPALARTYEALVGSAMKAGSRAAQIDAARDVFYRGFIADQIVDFATRSHATDTEGARHAGFLRADDLADFEAPGESPVTFRYRGLDVHKCDAWSQGPVLLQQLAILARRDLDFSRFNSTDHVHGVTEVAKLAFADREAWYGDPQYVDVPLEELLGDDYSVERSALIGDRASLELRPGSPGGRAPMLAAVAPAEEPAAGAGEPTRDTCHIAVVDRHRNMVAATPSGGWLQSSPTIPELGFCLGTRAQVFWLEEGLANSLQPRKRPRTTLSPTLVTSDGRPRLAFGTPGGDQQDQWQLNFLLGHLHSGLNLQEAIDAPMFHTEHFPSSFWPRAALPGRLNLEGRFDPEVVRELRDRGHDVVVEDDWSLGRLCAVGVEEDLLKAAADPRGGQGYAVGR